MNDDRMPPYNLDAEEAVLGSLLIDGDSIQKVADLLKATDFYRDRNQWVYEAAYTLYNREEAINQITVASELGRSNRLEAAGAGQMEAYPWLLVFPAIFFSLTLFCLNFLGDGLRDALDPKSAKD